MVVGRRAAKATAVVKVAGLVVVMATCRQKECREPVGCKAQPLARSCGSIPADEEAEQLCDAPAEWRATHGQWCASVRPRRRALVAKDGPLNVLESCSSPISALGMGLSPKFPDAGAGSPDTKTNASTISPRISSRNMPPHLSSRIVEISVSNEGSRAPVGCGLHMRALSGGCASFPERTEGLTMRPHTSNAELIMVMSSGTSQVWKGCRFSSGR